MRPEERDPAYLWDMLEAARAVVGFLEETTLEEFLEDSKEKEILRLAVERELEILGEVARRISAQFRGKHPDLPWKEMIALRNIISHEYDKVNYEEIYRIVRENIPQLIASLEPLVPPAPPLDE